MRLDIDDRFWIVVNPTPEGPENNIVLGTSLRHLKRQFEGTLPMDRNPTLFTDENEARTEALGRLAAMRASTAIRDRLRGGEDVDLPLTIEVHGGDGTVLFRAEIATDGAEYAADIGEDA